ncbi:hypothetical protein ACNTMW_34120, partial [Planosporangium sp. 12N6]|uniref:hypothetical protein n=1 Tax=Planosporangium spinosum TaxID=3402278 RepID=UPI003CFA1CEE
RPSRSSPSVCDLAVSKDLRGGRLLHHDTLINEPVVHHLRGRSLHLFGRWRVRNRKLVDVTDPSCVDWVEFDAVAQAEPIFGGLGHVDRIWADASAGGDAFEGFTLRQFDPGARVWRIWWASSRQPGHLDPPVEGRWEDGRGRFLCEDVINGRRVKVRFEWTNDSPSTARWEQAFSYDNAATWHVNWIMELVRID